MEKNKKTEWSVTDLISKLKVVFKPIWQEKEEQNVDGLENPTEATRETECAFIEVTVKDEEGKERLMKFNYLDLYGFIYFIGNEELRRQLALRYERDIVYLPYEVTFRIDEEEKKAGVAKRRIELPIDEVAMAMVRAKAMVLEGSTQAESDEQLKVWRTTKINNIPNQIKETYETKSKESSKEGNEKGGEKSSEEGKEITLLD